MEIVYFAGGCLWGVQAFIKTLPGVQFTEAGRANGTSQTLDGDYDGYAECVKTGFDPEVLTMKELMGYFFEIIDPYRNDHDLIVVEVLPLTNYVRSAEEHQDRLARCPNDYCHIPEEILSKYK
jgi:peptide-methionine (S)-S-oxide reductase